MIIGILFILVNYFTITQKLIMTKLTYFAVIVDIIIIMVILVASATLLPWLYPFLYFVQVYMSIIFVQLATYICTIILHAYVRA